MKTSDLVKAAGALALVIGLSTLDASAGQGNRENPGVIPPQANSHGQTYGEWGDQWWQWGFSFPADINPLLDPTGQNGALGQSGPVWFLAGTTGGNAERIVTVPPGKALFFPIVNNLWINIPGLGDNPWSPDQEALARAYISLAIDDMTNVTCTVDGKAVQNLAAYRCQTPPGGAFMTYIPPNDIWGLVGLGTVDGGVFQPGIYGPSVQDGIYVMLAPLPAGPHEIHFSAAGAHGWGLDVTYHLTVKNSISR
jgi:hypothetical protein